MTRHRTFRVEALALALLLMLPFATRALASVGLADVSWSYLYSRDASLETAGGDMCHGEHRPCMQLCSPWMGGCTEDLKTVNIPLLPNTSCRLFQFADSDRWRVEKRWRAAALYEGDDFVAAKRAFESCTPLPLVLVDVHTPNAILASGAISLGIVAFALFVVRELRRALRPLRGARLSWTTHRRAALLAFTLLVSSSMIVGALGSIVGDLGATLQNAPFILSPFTIALTLAWVGREFRRRAGWGTKIWAALFILLNAKVFVPSLFSTTSLDDWAVIPLVPYYLMLLGLGTSRWLRNRKLRAEATRSETPSA